ncbi:hypothetical protein B4N89_27550 [Embleya scabrispora]|uniref:Uncharacterized protein n=1 Tax=Embleya scabrispora TaxID=159449 RepID=A0A1T3P541_9ACTN|nr:hypothetical protein [Embleya scabrispora]OPC84183.1 hypothetical protein B4N89_27550 [Embleya scabrispora]
MRDPDTRNPRRGHHAWKAIVTGALLGSAAQFLPVHVHLVFLAISLCLMFGGILRSGWHDRGNCDICIRHAPVDGAVEAYELSPVLAVYHLLRKPWFVGAYITSILAGLIVVALFQESWARWFYPMPLLFVAATEILARLHAPVSPWCFRCHPNGGGGGGHDDIVDDPTPASPVSR